MNGLFIFGAFVVGALVSSYLNRTAPKNPEPDRPLLGLVFDKSYIVIPRRPSIDNRKQIATYQWNGNFRMTIVNGDATDTRELNPDRFFHLWEIIGEADNEGTE